MTSLAFILNPLDQHHKNPNAAAKRALPVNESLPALSAAIPFVHWLGPSTVVSAHDLVHNAPQLQFRQPSSAHSHKHRRLPSAHVHDDNQEDDEDNDVYAGGASPTTSSEGEMSSCDDAMDVFAMASASATHPDSSKKKTRLCKEKGCTSLAVSRRSCVRHGGGSRCTFEGCTNGAKLRNRCFQHGGSTICLAAGCNSKAKRYGYCWSHGGGRICSTEGCVKVAAQGGSCWAHGGGNRCKLESCSKRSYQKHGYYCKAHASYNK
ncbi:hypothetical protein FI667_g8050, partial [Globisporangium splendens]